MQIWDASLRIASQVTSFCFVILWLRGAVFDTISALIPTTPTRSVCVCVSYRGLHENLMLLLMNEAVKGSRHKNGVDMGLMLRWTEMYRRTHWSRSDKLRKRMLDKRSQQSAELQSTGFMDRALGLHSAWYVTKHVVIMSCIRGMRFLIGYSEDF